MSRWLDETLAIVRTATEGPQIVLGSSMGGYLALLAARDLIQSGEAGRLAGLILIAPAVDFTEALIWDRAPEEARRAIVEEGAWRRPSAYSDGPDVFTRALIEDGRKHLLLGGMISNLLPDRGAAGHARRGRALRPRARADGAARRRPGLPDAGQGRRPPAVAAAGSPAAVRARCGEWFLHERIGSFRFDATVASRVRRPRHGLDSPKNAELQLRAAITTPQAKIFPSRIETKPSHTKKACFDFVGFPWFSSSDSGPFNGLRGIPTEFFPRRPNLGHEVARRRTGKIPRPAKAHLAAAIGLAYQRH